MERWLSDSFCSPLRNTGEHNVTQVSRHFIRTCHMWYHLSVTVGWPAVERGIFQARLSFSQRWCSFLARVAHAVCFSSTPDTIVSLQVYPKASIFSHRLVFSFKVWAFKTMGWKQWNVFLCFSIMVDLVWAVVGLHWWKSNALSMLGSVLHAA